MALGLREYARHRKARGLSGTTLRAVQDAIASGRLTVTDGKIADAAAADAQWLATTREDRRPDNGPAAKLNGGADSPHPTQPAVTTQDQCSKLPVADTNAGTSTDPPPLAISRARREAVLAELAERELAISKHEFISAEVVSRDLMALFSNCRTHLLAIPSKLIPRLQARGLSREVALKVGPIVDDLIRESLVELADGRVTKTGRVRSMRGDEGEP